MNIAAAARAAAQHCEAKKDRLVQGQSGDWRVTFTVSPLDMPASLMAARPGTRYMLALVEIGDDEQPVSTELAPPGGSSLKGEPNMADRVALGKPADTKPDAAPPREAPQRCPTAAPDRLVTYVGMSCGDPRFQAWLKSYVDLSGDLDHQGAIHCVHQLLGVKSRAEISTDPIARQKALDLMTDYDIHIGKHAKDYTA